MKTPTRNPSLIAAVAGWSPFLLVFVADWLFYDHPLGWSLGLFLLLVLAAVLLRAQPDRSDAVTWRLAGLVVGFACALVYQPGPLVVLMGLSALCATVLNQQLGWTSDSARWGRRMRTFFALGSRQLVGDTWRSRGRLPRVGALTRHVLGSWALPIGLSAIFIVLFSVANPVLEGWGEDLADGLGRAFEGLFGWMPEIEIARILFWVGSGALLWPLVRTRLLEDPVSEVKVADGAENSPSTDFVFRCLLLFNLVFLAQSALDVFYLWGGAALPEGMSYAEYAHRGAYPLVATALLAALFVLVCFRPGGPAERDPRTRKLVVAWIAQNLLLMVSTVWRLMLYIDVYSMTRLRIATILWIALVAVGFTTICWRIQFAKTDRWLLGANLSALLLVLSISSFLDFDSRIAWYNAKNCREVSGSGPTLDIHYLGQLGPESLPALRWYEQEVGPQREELDATTAWLARRLVANLDDWRGWTLTRFGVRRALGPEWLSEKLAWQSASRRDDTPGSTPQQL